MWHPVPADIDASIEAALQLRDELRDGSVEGTLCCKMYPPDENPRALPNAVDELLGECSGMQAPSSCCPGWWHACMHPVCMPTCAPW